MLNLLQYWFCFTFWLFDHEAVGSWASQVVLVVKNPPADAGDARRHEFNPWVEKIPRRRAWQPTPVFLPGKSHGQRSLVGYSPWGRKELDTTEQLRTCMWDFSSLTRDQTHSPCIRRQSFNFWTPRGVPRNSFELGDLNFLVSSIPVLSFSPNCIYYICNILPVYLGINDSHWNKGKALLEADIFSSLNVLG